MGRPERSGAAEPGPEGERRGGGRLCADMRTCVFACGEAPSRAAPGTAAGVAVSRRGMTPEKELQGETIEEFFSDDFFKTNFWTYWATSLPLKNGTQQPKCGVMQCALFTILMVCLTLPH